MMNMLYLVIPSNLKRQSDVLRMAKSIDISNNIKVYFINQSTTFSLEDVYVFKNCKVNEIKTGKIIPLSRARNIALEKIYSLKEYDPNISLIMFIDDDAWFPKDTIDYLLECDIRCFSLKTIDPILNRSFSLSKGSKGPIKGWHIVHDMVSICIVLPLKAIDDLGLFFNEKLGLGNEISQGEESLFVYKLYKNGYNFEYDSHLIYHPYKKDFNVKNKYSMSYFWSLGFHRISKIYFIPCAKYMIKYTIALFFVAKDNRYLEIFRNVWRGFFDGKSDNKHVLEEK